MTHRYDIVIAGAGPAGIAAAVEASRSGAKTALIERYGIVGGNLTAGYVGPIMGSVCSGTIASEIGKLVCPNGDFCPDFERSKYELTMLLVREKVDVYLQTMVIGAEKENGLIRRIETCGKDGRMFFEADIFIDATGDGDLSVMAGCEQMIGRERDSLVQPVSLMFIISGVDRDQTLVCRHEEDETVMENGRGYLALCREAHASGELPPAVNIVRLYRTEYPDERMVNATQANRVDPLNAKALFAAEADLREQMHKIVAFLKKNVPGFEDIRVKASSSTLGVRESRRIRGDYLLTAEDVSTGREFDDTVVHLAAFPMDIHNPDGPGQSVSETGCPKGSGRYDIPYRCLLPVGAENLLTAGRCISGTHEAASSYRVMRIAMAIGQAAGAAAALASAKGCTARELDAKLVREHLIRRGAAL
ncbi:MAG: FAD-dependent oxidoreductase [Oscillospiraceae bacterium]|nr:FAD-dependent oxidoreductase [Oscillospiraceae bacterium]